MSDPLNITSLSERSLGGLPVRKIEDRVPYINAVIYGDYGVGKTRLLGTADDVPDMRKVLILDNEGGTFSLRGTNPNVESVRFNTWDDLQSIAIELVQGRAYEDYGTICLDSGTEAQHANFGHVTKIGVDKRPNHDEDLMEMQDWGRSLNQMRRMVRVFRDLPVNFLMTALSKDVKIDQVRTKKGPAFAGAFQHEIGALMDLVLYMYTKRDEEGNERRLILTKGTESALAKDRSDALPTVITEPSFKHIYTVATAIRAKDNTDG